MLELVVRVVLSLAVVLGLFWAVARFGSRRLGGGTRSLVRVVGRQALGRNASLAVVEVGERVLVVGVSESGVRLLTELDPAELPEPEPRATGRRVATGDDPVPARVAPGVRRSAVSGSLLSGQTWRQTWAAVTGRTVTEPADD